MRFTFQIEQWLPHPVPAVFAFFANPANLPRLMPDWQKARIEEAVIVPPVRRVDSSLPAPIAAGDGTRLTLSFRPFPYSPFRMRWEAEISDFVWDERFCDIQLRGPFAYWKHCHSVKAAEGDGIAGTCVADRIEYELPFGFLGRLARRLFIQAQLARVFDFRHRRCAEIFAEFKQQDHRPTPG